MAIRSQKNTNGEKTKPMAKLTMVQKKKLEN